MKNYELLCIIKTSLDMDSTEQVIQNINEAVSNFGGKVFSVDKIGRKKIAYEINGSRDGFYVVFNMELPEDKVAEMRRYLKLNENVIREMIQVKKKAVAV